MFYSLLLKNEVLRKYDSKKVTNAVNFLFQIYYETLFIVSDYDFIVKNTISDKVSTNKITDITECYTSIMENNVAFITKYEQQIGKIKKTFTEEEKIVYEYSIEKGESDSVIQELLEKFDKTYYNIKKSCYTKIYLSFRLDDKDSYFSKFIKSRY